MTHITGEIARVAAELRSADLPLEVRRAGVRSFLNILGCAVGGARHETTDIAEMALALVEGAPQATLVGRGRRTDMLTAALLNCLASAVYTFDDTLEGSLVHPGGSVAMPALAVGEWRSISGADFLAAFALGLEMTCRLAMASTAPTAKASIAWCATSVTGGVGAAVAAGRLLGLDATHMRNAIGIALSQASGFRVTQGSMNQSLIHAFPAQTGLRAALLAEHGFTSAEAPLEGRFGYLGTFSDEPVAEALTDGLGTRFEMLRNTFKPYPCGIVIHPIIDACLELSRTSAFDPTEIVRVEIATSPGAIALCDRPHPASEKQAVVSLQHWATVALLRGKARVVDLDLETAVSDSRIQAFQDRIIAVGDESIAPDASAVAIIMADGSRLEKRIDHCVGSASNPLSDVDLERKFIDQAEPALGVQRARDLAAMAWEIESLTDMGMLTRMAA